MSAYLSDLKREETMRAMHMTTDQRAKTHIKMKHDIFKPGTPVIHWSNTYGHGNGYGVIVSNSGHRLEHFDEFKVRVKFLFGEANVYVWNLKPKP